MGTQTLHSDPSEPEMQERTTKFRDTENTSPTFGLEIAIMPKIM